MPRSSANVNRDGRQENSDGVGELTTLRQAQKELTRTRLVEAAVRAFARLGYVDATIDDILREARISRGTFYAHFSSKFEILQEARKELTAKLTILIDDLVLDDPDLDDLEAWFDRFVDIFIEHRSLFAALHQALVVEPHALSEALEQYLGLVFLLRGSTNLEEGDLRLAGTMVFSLLSQFTYLWLVEGVELERQRVIKTLAQIVRLCLSPENLLTHGDGEAG